MGSVIDVTRPRCQTIRRGVRQTVNRCSSAAVDAFRLQSLAVPAESRDGEGLQAGGRLPLTSLAGRHGLRLGVELLELLTNFPFADETVFHQE